MARTSKAKKKRISLFELMEMFPTEETAMQYIESVRWNGARYCGHCGSFRTVESKHPTMPYRCKDCRKHFSVRTGTLMQDSRLPYRKWLAAIYLMGTNIKGISSTKLGNELAINQNHAWFLGHRIRKAWQQNANQLLGMVVEVDEAYLGGLEKNKHRSKRKHKGSGGTGKEIVVAIKSRDTKKVRALRIPDVSRRTLHYIIIENVAKGSVVFTDDNKAYYYLEAHGYEHQSVHHTAGEYVSGQATTNGVESFWALLKRGYNGIYHKMSPKHLQRYVDEFAGRYNLRHLDMLEQMDSTIKGLVGKRLTYEDLVKENQGT